MHVMVGFGLSHKAARYLKELGCESKHLDEFLDGLNKDPKNFASYSCDPYDIKRHNELLVKTVEDLGLEANGNYSKLKIQEVSSPYRIEEYDGFERVVTSYDWESLD